MEKPKNILVIDDEPNVRCLFGRQLKEAGFRVFEAANGKKSFTLLETMPIDLVVLDLLLPESNGLEVYDQIRKRFPAAKIIVSSIHPVEEQAFFIADADDYYYKSESISLLLDKIIKIMGGEK
ncbi:MAG: response regulator [Candidatus Omnitrophota bacterium]|nr:response regulator [Candidatus Omnitrophota bacterium]